MISKYIEVNIVLYTPYCLIKCLLNKMTIQLQIKK